MSFNNISVLIFQKKSQQQQHQQQNQQQQQHQTRQNQEDEYGFATGGATALPTSNGFHNPSQGSDSNADKWYMHDSMKPVGAPVHGGNCKCYRCQRKLTAI